MSISYIFSKKATQKGSTSQETTEMVYHYTSFADAFEKAPKSDLMICPMTLFSRKAVTVVYDRYKETVPMFRYLKEHGSKMIESLHNLLNQESLKPFKLYEHFLEKLYECDVAILTGQIQQHHSKASSFVSSSYKLSSHNSYSYNSFLLGECTLLDYIRVTENVLDRMNFILKETRSFVSSNEGDIAISAVDLTIAQAQTLIDSLKKRVLILSNRYNNIEKALSSKPFREW